jgi:hypothetical protein
MNGIVPASSLFTPGSAELVALLEKGALENGVSPWA